MAVFLMNNSQPGSILVHRSDCSPISLLHSPSSDRPTHKLHRFSWRFEGRLRHIPKAPQTRLAVRCTKNRHRHLFQQEGEVGRYQIEQIDEYANYVWRIDTVTGRLWRCQLALQSSSEDFETGCGSAISIGAPF